jgi:hypothetical protein
VAWWSERRCAARWGRLIRPDGYGRWRDGDAEVDFFLEVDRATEPPHRLAAKLTGYRNLVAATKIATPVLFWFPSPERETAARLALGATSSARSIPIATASNTPGRPADPAGPVWLLVGGAELRRRLARLAGSARARPHGPPAAALGPDAEASDNRPAPPAAPPPPP